MRLFIGVSSFKVSIIQPFVDSTISLNRRVFEEDRDICKRISYSDWIALIDGPLSDDEIKILNFRNNVRVV